MYKTMKNFFGREKAVFSSALFLMAALTAQAQTLKIAGTFVTETTASIHTSEDGCSIVGTVSYDADTKTLTLDNATITCHKANAGREDDTPNHGIQSDVPGLTIKLVGKNEIRVGLGDTNQNEALSLNADAVITSDDGTGFLNMNRNLPIEEGVQYAGHYESVTWVHKNATLTLKNCSVESPDPMHANGTLVIENSVLSLTSDIDDDSNLTWKDIVLKDVKVEVPLNGYYDKGDGTFYTEDDEWYEGPIRIVPAGGGTTPDNPGDPGTEPDDPNASKLDEGNFVTICGVTYTASKDNIQVLNSNLKDNGGYGLLRGTISLDATTKTLTLDNVYLASNDDKYEATPVPLILADTEGLTIVLVGDNELSWNDGVGLQIAKNTTITSNDGTGTLRIGSRYLVEAYGDDIPSELTDPKGIVVDELAKLTIKNCIITLPTGLSGTGRYDYETQVGGILEIDDARLDVTAESLDSYQEAAIMAFKDVVIKNATIVTPNGGSYDAERKLLLNANGTYHKGAVSIVGGHFVGIQTVGYDKGTAETLYNLNGQQVRNNYKGLVIAKGRKYLAK